MSASDNERLLDSGDEDRDEWSGNDDDDVDEYTVDIRSNSHYLPQPLLEPQHNVNDDTDMEGMRATNEDSQNDRVTKREKKDGIDYEALDYDTIENSLYYEEERKMTISDWRCTQLKRWVICMLIGVLTGLTAILINVCILQLTELKQHIISQAIGKCVLKGCFYIPLLMWLSFNAVLSSIGAILTVFVAPVAAGSGIPQIKCFLNGVKVPNVVRLKTLVTKVVGVIAAVSGGLAVGKEGPMIHSGAVIAAGISQGRSLTFKTNFGLFSQFRNDREKRDFVCAGASAGVAAAFGAPVGGVLFSLEEAASFWNQSLTWRIFICSILSSYTLNFFMSLYNGHVGDLTYPGLINFGKFEGTYAGFEVFIFALMGVIGGLLGALFNAFNHRITMFRIKYLKNRVLKVLEVMVVALNSAMLAFMMMYIFRDECRPLGQDSYVELQFFCSDGGYNVMASLFFSTPEDSVKSLFHDPIGTFTPVILIAFVIFYFILACWTYGLQVPSGLFIPALLIGAAWGRLVGIMMNKFCPDCFWAQDMSKYALIGAAAQLGGTVRMTISLTVILIEATGNITYLFPLMSVLLISKLTGDFFNEGIYDKHVHLSEIPILEWEPPPLSSNIFAREVMSSPAVCLKEVPRVKDVCSVLSDPSNCHSGYPIVDEDGKFRGSILRSQLLILLSNKAFVERRSEHDTKVSLSAFRDSYPRNPQISYINVSADEQNLCHLDLRPYLNPAPYTVYEQASLPRIFRLFRALGLRHLVVLNDEFKVAGIVTRKDIWKWGRQQHA